MDRILVFDQGHIIEEGTIESLLKANGHFAMLWNMQTDGLGKFFKYLFYTILTLVLLVIIGVSVLIYTFNPNSLKGPITQQVKAETGRSMAINGDITWRFYPWLGFSIHGIQYQTVLALIKLIIF